VSKCVQLSISCEDAEALTLLRDRINRLLLQHAGAAAGPQAPPPTRGGKAAAGAAQPRRPLAPRSLNTLAAVQAPSSGCAPSGRSGPTASGFSLGCRGGGAAASSADSAAACGALEEELGSLSEEQQHAVQLVRGGKSIFFTGGRSTACSPVSSLRFAVALADAHQCGPSLQSCCDRAVAVHPHAQPFPCAALPLLPPGCAGTGKSLLLRAILRCLPRETTYVTGTTGLAACHLGGTTINAFAGIGRGEGSLGARRCPRLRLTCSIQTPTNQRMATLCLPDLVNRLFPLAAPATSRHEHACP
jgi:hypothetical protein